MSQNSIKWHPTEAKTPMRSDQLGPPLPGIFELLTFFIIGLFNVVLCLVSLGALVFCGMELMKGTLAEPWYTLGLLGVAVFLVSAYGFMAMVSVLNLFFYESKVEILDDRVNCWRKDTWGTKQWSEALNNYKGVKVKVHAFMFSHYWSVVLLHPRSRKSICLYRADKRTQKKLDTSVFEERKRAFAFLLKVSAL